MDFRCRAGWIPTCQTQLRSAISGKTVHTPKAKIPYRKNPDKINLLVDIQAKLQTGKGPGYERWAKIFNLKQMAQTINFLTENNITDYETLVEKTKAATDRYHELSQQIKQIEKRMAEIIELKKHIINYAKTKEIYANYCKSGYTSIYFEKNAEVILIHQSAKKAFNQLKNYKIPSISQLNKELNESLLTSHALQKNYTQSKSKFREIANIKLNVDTLLALNQESINRSSRLMNPRFHDGVNRK